MTARIATVDMRVDSIRHKEFEGFQIRAYVEKPVMNPWQAASIFFAVQDACDAPRIDEIITITIERSTDKAPPEATDKVPETLTEIPVPEAVRRRFREEAAADFGHGTQENQREYQRLIAKWQEEHPKGVDATDKPPWKCHLCGSKEEGRHQFPCV